MFNDGFPLTQPNQSFIERNALDSQCPKTSDECGGVTLNGGTFPAQSRPRLVREIQASKLNDSQNQGSGLTTLLPLIRISTSNCLSPVVNPKLSRQFYKTRMCPFFERGHCRREDQCTYAHSKSELKTAPDLYKTKLCENWQNGSCTEEMNCRFAHGRQELRFTSQVYKTRICHFWLTAECSKGRLCRHAHGTHELRVDPKEEIHEDVYSAMDQFSDASLVMRPNHLNRRRRSYTTSFLTNLRQTKGHPSYKKLLPQSSFSNMDLGTESVSKDCFSASKLHPTMKKFEKKQNDACYTSENLFDLYWNVAEPLRSNKFYSSNSVAQDTTATVLSSFPQEYRQEKVDKLSDHSTSFQQLQSPKWEAYEDIQFESSNVTSQLTQLTSKEDPYLHDPVQTYFGQKDMYLDERPPAHSTFPCNTSAFSSDFFRLLNHEKSANTTRQNSLCDFRALSNKILPNSIQRFDSFSCSSQQERTPSESLDALPLQHNKVDNSLNVMQIFHRSASSPLSLLNRFQLSTCDEQQSCLNANPHDTLIMDHLSDAFQAVLHGAKTNLDYFPISSHPVSPRTLPTSPVIHPTVQENQPKSLLQSSFSFSSLYSEAQSKPCNIDSQGNPVKLDSFSNNTFSALQNINEQASDPLQTSLNSRLTAANGDSSDQSISQYLLNSTESHSNTAHDSPSKKGWELLSFLPRNLQPDALSHSNWEHAPGEKKSQSSTMLFSQNLSHNEMASKFSNTPIPFILNPV